MYHWHKSLRNNRMDTTSIIEPKSNSLVTNNNDKENSKLDKKQTVLEKRGYTLGKTIGIGCYATVKIANSENHGCQVAIKIVSKFHAPEEYLAKFLPREIDVVKRLKHSNLIRFYQAIETTHRVYIIMEYAENGNLLDVIRQHTYISESQSRQWFVQLLSVVDYCHERGVVHRDIKCENLLMDHNFNIKLSDFGFARTYMRQKNGQVSLCETFCGSYAYASPEILKGIPYNPILSDIWSIGVVLYAMIFGRLPFKEDNYVLLLKQVQSKIILPEMPKVSHACRSLITRILSPSRHRPQMSDIKSDIWLMTPIVTAQTSTTESEMLKCNDLSAASGMSEVKNETKVNLISEIPQLVTEEALKQKDHISTESTASNVTSIYKSDIKNLSSYTEVNENILGKFKVNKT